MAKFANLLLVFLLLPMACEKEEVILENLTQKDANQIMVILRDKNINAKKITVRERKSASYQISVTDSQVQDALRLLVHNQLPKESSFGLKEVYPPGSSAVIPTKSDESARLIMALQGEIEGLIKILPGVVDARVVLSMNQSKLLNKEQPQKTASIAIIFQPLKDSQESPISDSEIKALVSSSISDLISDNVQVVQKELKPVKYLDIEEVSNKTPIAPTLVDSGTPQNLVWLSLCITALALLTGAYAMARPLIKRRSKHIVSDSSASTSEA